MNQRYQHYLRLKQQQPEKYARELAQLMSISEAELAWARVGQDAQRLNGDVTLLLKALGAAGETKSITRNEYAVHELIGRYDNVHFGERGGLVLNPRGLDLRLIPDQWNCAFYLHESFARGERFSLQIFDHQGDAVLKIYATEQTDMAAWQRVVSQFAGRDNAPLTLKPAAGPAESAQVDNQALIREWRAMTDVHQFYPLLKRHGVTRQQAFRAVSDDLAWQVDNQALRQILVTASQAANDIMIFVGNRGCIQIFTGQIERLSLMDRWANVFNTQFILHVQEPLIAESWVTRKPTDRGMVTSLELFAADGTQIAQLYGQRTEGNPEQPQWRNQINRLLRKDVNT